MDNDKTNTLGWVEANIASWPEIKLDGSGDYYISVYSTTNRFEGTNSCTLTAYTPDGFLSASI